MSSDDAEARGWLAFLRRRGHRNLTDLRIERVYWLEGRVQVEKLIPLFANPVHQTASAESRLDPALGSIIEITYRPAVTDPETPSILAAATALGEKGLEFARLSKRYQFGGADAYEARAIAERFLFNKVVERIREPGERPVSLRPSGEPEPVDAISLAGLSDAELQHLSAARSWYAPLSQMKVIQAHERRIGRPHWDAEIEILAQSWSDHCYHTTWKSLGLLKRLSEATRRIAHPLVVSAFTDNAGGLEFYDGWVVTIKGETHNFPSSIAPFGGVATKHGGVIRDTLGFGKGAYPIGGTTLMGTMEPSMAEDAVPEGALHPQLIVSESVRATAYYMNPMGIPMMHPVYRQHPGYAKCLALGHSLGLIPKRYAAKEKPRPGDLVLLIGGETGRDGIHGATASSTSMTGETLAKEAAAVQIGHPITERCFATAIPALRDADCIRSITDLGAGGISCGAGEMGAETGVALDLDTVPLKDRSLSAWEILLSESQERMLIALPPEKLTEAGALLDRYDVRSAVIGRFTDSGRLDATWRGQEVASLEMDFLWGACPLDPISVAEPRRSLKPVEIPEPENADEWSRAVRSVLGHYHCADQSAAGARFDSTVQGRTAVGPYGGKNRRMPSGIYVSAPLHGRYYGAISTIAWNPFHGDIDPAVGAKLAVIEAVTKAVAAGADYRELALCDNFYTPRVRPESARDLVRMVEAIAQLSLELGIPFISGKDSSSGTFESKGRVIEAPPTLAVAAFGRVPDVRRVVTKDFKRAGNRLAVAGFAGPDALGGSVYADHHGQRGDQLFDAWDAASLKAHWDALLGLHARGAYVSASAIAEGGIALRLFEAAYGSGLGARVDASYLMSLMPPAAASVSARKDGFLFGEFTGSVLLEIAGESGADASVKDSPYAIIGEVADAPHLSVAWDGVEIWREDVSSLAGAWEKPFREVLE
ncbi:MAG: phosphoribosylformylglycinamidine synthase subunit PurS [Terriglobia bacterium]